MNFYKVKGPTAKYNGINNRFLKMLLHVNPHYGLDDYKNREDCGKVKNLSLTFLIFPANRGFHLHTSLKLSTVVTVFPP